jgi:predicted transcriptional regulator
MILSQLKAYLAERGPVPIASLADRFEVEPDTMRGMLEHLIRKGLVRRMIADKACGDCMMCDAHSQELYKWSDPHHAKERFARGRDKGPRLNSATR